MIPRLKSGQDGWSISIGIDKDPESHGAIHHAPYQHDSKNCAEKNADFSQSQKMIRCSWAKSLQICIVDGSTGSTATFHDLRLDPVSEAHLILRIAPWAKHTLHKLVAWQRLKPQQNEESGFMAMIFIGIKNQPFYPAW